MEEEHAIIPEGGFALLSHVATDGKAVTCCKFDSHEEIFWTGTASGRVTSYYDTVLGRYTSMNIFSPQTPVVDILPNEGGIIALSYNQLKGKRRQGLSWFSISTRNMTDCRCMSTYYAAPDHVVIAGSQPQIVLVNIETGQEVRSTNIGDEDCQIVQMDDRYIYTSDSTGKVTIRNGQTMQVHNVVQLHEGIVTSIACTGNKLVTCGSSLRHDLSIADRFLMVYDVRNMRVMSPLSVPIGPSFVKFLPSYSENRIVVAATSGDVNVLEMGEVGMFFNLDTGGMPLSAIDVSPSVQCIAFTDASGSIHLMSDRATPVFHLNSQPTNLPEPEIPPPTSISYNDLVTPYSLIPCPIPQDDIYASQWPPQLINRVHREPLEIDASLLESMRMVQFVGYAPNPGTRRRNQVPYDLATHTVEKPSLVSNGLHTNNPPIDTQPQINTENAPLAVTAVNANPRPIPTRHRGMPLQSPSGRGADDPFAQVPKLYRKVHIRPHKFGTDDFEYKRYNSTDFCAIEAPPPHGYMSAFLVVLSQLNVLKNKLYSHLCSNEFCIACELGFLLRMCDININKHPSLANNFVHALRTFPKFVELDGKEIIPIDAFAKLVLDIVVEELSVTDPANNLSPIPENRISGENESTFPFKSSGNTIYSCECGTKKQNHFSCTSIPLMLPPKEELEAGKTTLMDFVSCSLNGTSSLVTKGNCATCDKSETSGTQINQFEQLADILAFNVSFTMEQWKEYSKEHEKYSTIKAALEAISKQECKFGERCKRPSCRYMHKHLQDPSGQSDDGKLPDGNWLMTALHIEKKDGKYVVDTREDCNYDLHSVVFRIKEEGEDEHWTTSVNTGGEWIVYNEFVVQNTCVQDALHMNSQWKIPAVIVYAKKETLRVENVNYREISPITASVFSMDAGLIVRRRLSVQPINEDELPVSGDLVAIDAEFVSVNHHVSQLDVMSLARVTCIRGSGDLQATTFIDDYICTQAQVADYLTQFSGINPGDLHPDSTSKHLTTLKSIYLKIRYMVDNGVIFVGHGLSSDFSVINIQVPPSQIKDTVHLFHLPHNRMISLKFLAWFFLDLRIQDETHDSVEDARTALKLYREYEVLKAEGEIYFRNKLDAMYARGRQLQWTIPPVES